ncbi:uncharacterized protein LOC134533452 [Bacillus rossius redtenbacheri]|uniref:uncharacterized protein LOC134533452 n=1 Tax=Bacillus rossius redtenbacheri TaxID=93214 RepID=UPI002FDCD19F
MLAKWHERGTTLRQTPGVFGQPGHATSLGRGGDNGRGSRATGRRNSRQPRMAAGSTYERQQADHLDRLVFDVGQAHTGLQLGHLFSRLLLGFPEAAAVSLVVMAAVLVTKEGLLASLRAQAPRFFAHYPMLTVVFWLNVALTVAVHVFYLLGGGRFGPREA